MVSVSTSSRVPTRGDVISFFAKLRFAVKLLLGQLIQQALVLVFLTRQRCPLVDKVSSAAHAVTHKS